MFGNRWAAPLAFVLLIACATIPWSILSAHLIMTALVAACALSRVHHLRWLTDNRVARHIGTVSYGIYLVNVPVVIASRRALTSLGLAENTWLVFLVGAAACVGIATLLHRVIERPFLRLRDRFRASGREITRRKGVEEEEIVGDVLCERPFELPALREIDTRTLAFRKSAREHTH